MSQSFESTEKIYYLDILVYFRYNKKTNSKKHR